MRRALVARPRPWRDFKVVASWRKGKGRGVRHGRAIVPALCPGSKLVWIAHRHQLLKVSQEQLRMATVIKSVADDVIHQELRAIGENSAADGQVLPKYLDISRDPLPPSVDESTQTSPRKERSDVIASKISARDLVHRQNPVQPRNTENSTSPEELVLRGSEVETERSTWPHRRISRKRIVDEEITSSIKTEQIASSDLSLRRSPSESPLPPSDDAMVRLRDKRQPENRSDEQSKRELAVIPWSGPSGEKRKLGVDDEEQQKKQCTCVCLCLFRCQMTVMRFCGTNLWSMTVKFLRNGLPRLEGSKK